MQFKLVYINVSAKCMKVNVKIIYTYYIYDTKESAVSHIFTKYTNVYKLVMHLIIINSIIIDQIY